MTHPPSPASKSGSRLPIHVFNSVCLGLVPGQMDSPYLIIMPWITIPRDEYYTIPGNQLFVPPRKYVHSLILQLVICLTAKWEQSPEKKVTLPAELNWVFTWEKRCSSLPSQELTTVLVHVLIVLSIPSLPGWASQSCFMEKKVRGPSRRVIRRSRANVLFLM